MKTNQQLTIMYQLNDIVVGLMQSQIGFITLSIAPKLFPHQLLYQNNSRRRHNMEGLSAWLTL